MSFSGCSRHWTLRSRTSFLSEGNRSSLARLRDLRPLSTYGGLFRWVSCPNYLCEILGWAGFAICTWSLGSVFVLGITIANLVPRALSTHEWYRQRFADYPAERKALVPFIL